MNRFVSEPNPEDPPIWQQFHATFAGTGVEEVFTSNYLPDQTIKDKDKEYQQILAKEGGDEAIADEVYQARSRFIAALPIIQRQLGTEYTMEDMIDKVAVLTQYTYWLTMRAENPPKPQ